MMWATLLSGFVLLSVISSGLSRSISDVEKPLSRWKRSIDLNDIYYSKMRQYRLPNEVTPTSYHVDIKIPFIQSNQFNGRVKINLTWSDTNDRITLNVDPNLEISLVSVRLIPSPDAQVLNDEPYLNVARTERQNRKSWYIIHLEQMMKNGSACEVDITYFGNLTTNETTGLYKSAYMDSEGQKHPFIATYLQLDNAQKMFPCMDEPPYKATFKLSVLYPKGLTARTNTPSISRHETSDKIEEEFAETPRMSTNQLALVISDLQNIEPTKEVNEMDGKKLQVKVWGRKEFMESLLTVPNKVVMIVNYLQDYFNCSLGLPKLDVMAIPMYSTSKASDNWGIMFFRESELSSSLVWTTAYELLYQWIGQSTTPYRRNDAPVNKALNSFLASMATIDLNPNEMEGKWPMTMMYPLYYEFAQTAPFSRVAGIRQEATWTKAELVFRMFNYTLGRDLFQRSVRNFFHQQSKEDRRTFFANDIFTYLNDVANETGNLPPGLTINGIAASWINRDRVPLVTVIRDYETGKINLSQKVYLRDIPPQSTAKVSYQWDIPIVMQAQDKLNFHNAKPTVWLKKENIPKNLTITDITEKNNFIIVNPEEIGMFPVNYDSCNWKMLSDYLQGPDRENIPPLTRAKLLHDAWNLAYAGELCFGVAMNMTLFLKKEKSHIVWEPVFTMIHHIGRRIEGLDVYLKFEAYIRSLLKPLYLELGEKPRPNEPSWKTHMRGLMQNFLCRAGYEPCVKEARDQFKKWLTDEEPDKGNPVLSGCEANETSSGQEVVPSVSSLDEETLKLLGDDPEKDESEKFSLQQDLVQRWKGWISSGLKKDMLEELLKKYGRSGNCPLDAPMLNPEIMASLSEVTTKRDKHFVQSQKMIGSAMVALGTAITMLLVNNDEGIDRLQLIENLCDAGKLLAATHYKESLARRAFISPGISKPLRTTLDNSKPEVFLYGSDLQAKIKEAKSIVRVGDDLKVKIAQKQSVEKLPNKNLNFKGPPAKQRNFSSVGNRQQSQSRRRFQSRSEHHRNERSISLVEKFLIPVINVTRSVFCARSSGTENRPIIRALFRQ